MAGALTNNDIRGSVLFGVVTALPTFFVIGVALAVGLAITGCSDSSDVPTAIEPKENPISEYETNEHGEVDCPRTNSENEAAAVSGRREELLDFNSEIASTFAYVTSTIDETKGTLTVWSKSTAQTRALAANAPPGVWVHFTPWTHQDLEQLRDGLELDRRSEGLGLELAHVREEGYGLSVEVFPDTGSSVTSIIDLRQDLAQEAPLIAEQLGFDPTGLQVCVLLVEDPGEIIDLSDVEPS